MSKVFSFRVLLAIKIGVEEGESLGIASTKIKEAENGKDITSTLK
ncbi:hypothetical protein FVEN_g12837 [Fusarium venenatum]|nr:hypothetical protein FVEN_g12837 [Fusarium venenatum]